MKVSTEAIENNEGITARRCPGVARRDSPTRPSKTGKVSCRWIDLNDTHAVIIVRNEGGTSQLRTVALP